MKGLLPKKKKKNLRIFDMFDKELCEININEAFSEIKHLLNFFLSFFLFFLWNIFLLSNFSCYVSEKNNMEEK